MSGDSKIQKPKSNIQLDHLSFLENSFTIPYVQVKTQNLCHNSSLSLLNKGPLLKKDFGVHVGHNLLPKGEVPRSFVVVALKFELVVCNQATQDCLVRVRSEETARAGLSTVAEMHV